MKHGAPGSFGAQLKALREAAGFTQEQLATIAGLSVHAVSALERGERRRPHVETVRALSAALDLTSAKRDALLGSARGVAHNPAVDELSGVSLPSALTALLGRDADVQTLRGWLADPERTGATVVDESVHDLNEQSEREVRARLGPDRWARAYAAGRSASIDSLMRDIDTARRSRARDADEAVTKR